MRRLFTSKRRELQSDIELSAVGDLRLIAKTATGAGVQEPVLGFLYCNGAAVSRATYKRLFDRIGTAYGVGDGSTTFNLPDFRGRFLVGATDGAAGTVITGLVRGGVLGAEAIALGKANIPVHTHAAGTLSVNSSGGHSHGQNFVVNTSTEESNDFAYRRGDGTGTLKQFDSGTIGANTHSHNIDAGTQTGNGAADSLAGTAHQNVHSHQAFGGVLICY
jgi:microcystin-dependent protein